MSECDISKQNGQAINEADEIKEKETEENRPVKDNNQDINAELANEFGLGAEIYTSKGKNQFTKFFKKFILLLQ